MNQTKKISRNSYKTILSLEPYSTNPISTKLLASSIKKNLVLYNLQIFKNFKFYMKIILTKIL